MLEFNSHGYLTLGVEIEMHLLDKETLNLTQASIDILSCTKSHPQIKPEIPQSTVEINTGVCTTVQEAEKDLRASIVPLKRATESLGLLLTSTGTHPFARYADQKIYPSERYKKLLENRQWIMQRMMICGMHTHIGMKDGDTCARFNNFFLRFIPHLLALTASSPFWQGEQTGLASCRSTIFESSPTAGHPYWLKDWKAFTDLYDQLIRCKAINVVKDIWWDIRPSPHYGTLELRICDGPATMQEAMAVAAFIHALAHWHSEHMDEGATTAPDMWVMRENKWRAVRYGLDALLIDYGTLNLTPLREDVLAWMQRIEPHALKLGYERYWQHLHTILERGPSYLRQLKVFEETGSLEAVTTHNVKEFETGVPAY